MKRCYLLRPFSLLSASVFLIIVCVSTTFAQSAHQYRAKGLSEDVLEGREIVREKVLTPLPGAEVVIPGLKAQFLEDGTVGVAGNVTHQAGNPPPAVRFEVNTEEGTYTTRKLDDDEVEKLLNKAGQNGALIEEEAVRKGSQIYDKESMNRGSSSEETLLSRFWNFLVPDALAAINPGTYGASLFVLTEDPADLFISSTDNFLIWDVAAVPAGVLSTSPGYFNTRCAWATQTEAGTHWFKQGCGDWDPFFSPNEVTKICYSGKGHYYNYDFLNNSLRTDVVHVLNICGKPDATVDFNWGLAKWGEGSSLLIFSVAPLIL